MKVELVNEHGEPIQVELPQERYRALGLRKGMRVYVTPKEKQVFTEDYSI